MLKIYHKNSNLAFKNEFDAPRAYHENGNLAFKTEFGFPKAYYENGRLAFHVEFGIPKAYYENGNLAFQIEFGTPKTYNENKSQMKANNLTLELGNGVRIFVNRDEIQLIVLNNIVYIDEFSKDVIQNENTPIEDVPVKRLSNVIDDFIKKHKK